MSNKKFRLIVIPILALLVVLVTAFTTAAATYSSALDLSLGRGQRHVVDVTGIPAESTQYYDVKNKNDKAGLGKYTDPTTDVEEKSRNDAAEIALDVAEEGITLLKNDGVLPLAKNAKITPFGYRYVQPIWAGTGASSTSMEFDYVVTPEEALTANFDVNKTVSDLIIGKRRADGVTDLVNISGLANGSNATDPDNKEYSFDTSGYLGTWSIFKDLDDGHAYDRGTDMVIHELNPDIYSGTESTCTGTTGIVFIGRLGMEGNDLFARGYEDGTPHELELTETEKQMLAFAKSNCSKVVVICNFNNIVSIPELEADNKINAILWIGSPGAKGLEAMSNILAGDVNPSGRTVDIWLADQTYDPSFVNIEPGSFKNTVSKSYYEYEEDVYMGYRYFETAAAEAEAGNYAGFDYDEQVVYPFGYGLHFENDKITQTLSDVRMVGNVFVVTGSIKNQSSRDVKETVQVYYGAPYYKDGSKIERPAKALAGFDKIEVAAGATEDFTIRIQKEDIAAYDEQGYYTANGAYVFEKGVYKFYLGKNSHDSWGEKSVEVTETTVYTDAAAKNGGVAAGKRTSDGIVAENQFPEITRYINDGNMSKMSRSNFSGTWPTKQVRGKDAPAYIVEKNANFTEDDAICGVNNENALLYKSEKPESGKDNGLTLSSLRGLEYDDPLWDDLLDQINFADAKSISALITYGLYCSQSYKPIGLSATIDVDGPLGLTATWSGTQGHVVACAYPSSTIIAATFNTGLTYEMGLAIGQEGLTNGITGWYGPAANLHRSQFGGRNFEYFSEDPVLSGYIMAYQVAGARQNGLIAHLKHFALNEMDRARGEVQIYASEQAIRELYLKPFEICTKVAEYDLKMYDGVTGGMKTVKMKATGAYMTSMTFIGPMFTGNSYALLTTVLRDEWGFEGFVITDFTSGPNKHKDRGYRVGNDLWMAMSAEDLSNLNTATAQWAARKAIHNIAFAYVNSNAYNGVAPGAYVYYDWSPWAIGLMVADIIAGVVILAGVALVVLRALDENKNPGKYKEA